MQEYASRWPQLCSLLPGCSSGSHSPDAGLPFASACWFSPNLFIPPNSGPFEILESFRDQLQLPFFMEIIVTMAWSIWTVRNDAIFKQVQPSLLHYRSVLRKEFAQVILRAKSSIAPFFLSQWLEAYV